MEPAATFEVADVHSSPRSMTLIMRTMVAPAAMKWGTPRWSTIDASFREGTPVLKQEGSFLTPYLFANSAINASDCWNCRHPAVGGVSGQPVDRQP